MDSHLDYQDVGLICGLEVHQQLKTERKLFCRCPVGLYTKDHDGTVLRHMRPTLSELGEYDGTALMEFKTRKNIVYLLHRSNVCTYEMDDTPPFLVNQKALDVAIEQCLMLGCDIVDEVHIARKQYLDGSIPTGFQRTAIVGVNGKLPFRGRELHITQVSVEEDSCREVSDRGHLIVWRADRLGTPLIETVTEPQLHTPDEVEEAILLIGRVCRSTNHVRTGMGASRQDVNVSVRGGRRVEIKGVPKAGWSPGLVHGEAVRQVNMLTLRDELHARGFKTPESIVTEHRDVTKLFAKSVLGVLRRDNWRMWVASDERRTGFEMGKGDFCVRAVRLNGLAGTVSWPGQPGRTFAHELAGRIRVIACLDQDPILLHSEDWPEQARDELTRLRKEMDCADGDSLVVVWGAEQDTVTAAQEIALRYADATDGVPNETRQPFEDGHTEFERILPGPDRMYPDTDSPPQRVTRERVERLEATLPEVPWAREQRYADAGVPTETIHYLIRRGGARLVDLVVQESKADLRAACFFFGERLKGLRRAGVNVNAISDERWLEFYSLASRHGALLEAWRPMVIAMAGQPARGAGEIAADLGLTAEADGWRGSVDTILKSSRPAREGVDNGGRLRFFMGAAMTGLRGRVHGSEVANAIRSAVEEQV